MDHKEVFVGGEGVQADIADGHVPLGEGPAVDISGFAADRVPAVIYGWGTTRAYRGVMVGRLAEVGSFGERREWLAWVLVPG